MTSLAVGGSAAGAIAIVALDADEPALTHSWPWRSRYGGKLPAPPLLLLPLPPPPRIRRFISLTASARSASKFSILHQQGVEWGVDVAAGCGWGADGLFV